MDSYHLGITDQSIDCISTLSLVTSLSPLWALSRAAVTTPITQLHEGEQHTSPLPLACNTHTRIHAHVVVPANTMIKQLHNNSTQGISTHAQPDGTTQQWRLSRAALRPSQQSVHLIPCPDWCLATPPHPILPAVSDLEEGIRLSLI